MDFKKGTYLHYKKNEYLVIAEVTHTETSENMVLYHPVGKPDCLYVRPYKMFFGMVIKDQKEIPRFKLIS